MIDMKPLLACCLIVLLLAGQAFGAAPLFESDESLALTIEAPMRQLLRERIPLQERR